MVLRRFFIGRGLRTSSSGSPVDIAAVQHTVLVCMSEVKPALATTDYEDMRKWRQAERAHMVETIRDTIEEARRRAKSPRTTSGEMIRWTRLVGQLIWYKDSILKAMSYEALEKEVAALKEHVFSGENQAQKPPPLPAVPWAKPESSPRRTIKGPTGLHVQRITKSTSSAPRRILRKRGSAS